MLEFRGVMAGEQIYFDQINFKHCRNLQSHFYKWYWRIPWRLTFQRLRHSDRSEWVVHTSNHTIFYSILKSHDKYIVSRVCVHMITRKRPSLIRLSQTIRKMLISTGSHFMRYVSCTLFSYWTHQNSVFLNQWL